MTVVYINPDQLHKNPAFTQVASVPATMRMVYVGGQNAVDGAGQVVGKGDIALQTRQTLKNLETALAAAGATVDDIIKWNLYIVQGQSLQAGFAEFQRFWGDRANPPVITSMFVVALANPEYLLEMDAVAAIPDR